MYLCYCGQSRCMPLHNYGPTVRPNYIIHYITEGKGCFYAEGNKYELEAGQGFLIVPGQQTFYQADKELPWTYLWVGFDGGNVESYLKEIGLTSEKPVYRCENGKVLQEIVGEMLENQKASFSGQLLLEGLLYRFFAALAENIEMPALSRQESENLYVKRAMEFIRNNYFEDIKVTDIADYVSVNRSYLYTLFQKSLHMSPSRYLAEIRMSQAEKLLFNDRFFHRGDSCVPVVIKILFRLRESLRSILKCRLPSTEKKKEKTNLTFYMVFLTSPSFGRRCIFLDTDIKIC